MARCNVLTKEDKFICTEFAKVIRGNRKRLKLSQQKLADRLGLSRQIICSWERGVSRITLPYLLRLVDNNFLTFDEINFSVKRYKDE